ncbi:hypothetical protein Cs7R123_80250 [Catellatospora sp. TT07R-123]|uniref:hypothetical protein n=1 Tax=Catellatospora sp. TT07R-123 TaxID=2733863 RepID=UPI001B1A89B0|nr:hypothetical protein [Catellatospora sp. TT07R-123]GHJ50683.1 hypothetical protein Cs7R123_80250 [Catellatospora sp. TT07R-123]
MKAARGGRGSAFQDGDDALAAGGADEIGRGRGRIVATAAKLLAQRGRGRALISICAAGGQGVVAVLER